MKDSKTAKTLSYILIAVLLVLYIMPLLFVINISFKSFTEYLLDPIGLVKVFNGIIIKKLGYRVISLIIS